MNLSSEEVMKMIDTSPFGLSEVVKSDAFRRIVEVYCESGGNWTTVVSGPMNLLMTLKLIQDGAFTADWVRYHELQTKERKQAIEHLEAAARTGGLPLDTYFREFERDWTQLIDGKPDWADLVGTRGGAVNDEGRTRALITGVIARHVPKKTKKRFATIAALASLVGVHELLSNLVYGRLKSSGFAVDLSFIDTVDELDTVDHVGELLKAT